jgi:hypothetical protein
MGMSKWDQTQGTISSPRVGLPVPDSFLQDVFGNTECGAMLSSDGSGASDAIHNGQSEARILKGECIRLDFNELGRILT